MRAVRCTIRSWRAESRNWRGRLTSSIRGPWGRSKRSRRPSGWEFRPCWKDCNAHTGFAMEVVQKECERLGVTLPPDHEHAYNAEKLRKEEEEYRLATRLLCPSDFVVKTFLDKGYAREQLARHIYGYDEKVYYPGNEPRDPKRGLTMLFVGVCAVRKGVHYALEAWLRSPASKDGTFLIAGEFLPAYQEKLASMLAHPSVKVLGHRNDVPELMRKSDILVLPEHRGRFRPGDYGSHGQRMRSARLGSLHRDLQPYGDGTDASRRRRRSADPAHHDAARRSRPAGKAARCGSRSCSRESPGLPPGECSLSISRNDCGPQGRSAAGNQARLERLSGVKVAEAVICERVS